MRSVVVLYVVCVGACSGPSFTPSDCEDANCAGANSGGELTGGATQGGTAGEGGESTGGGGSNNGGSNTGGANAGGSGGSGMSGSSGSGTSGSAGSAGSGMVGFPSTPVLDDFNRDALELGAYWIGSSELYEVRERTLNCPAGYCQATFWFLAFEVAQEVFATLVSFSEYSPEINLVFKAQGLDCDLIEVFYAPSREEVLIEACWGGVWRSFGSVYVRFERGDQLGGRARSDGFIEIFRNGELLDTVDANDYPYIGSDGFIGVNGVVGDGEAPNVYDDFGGGSL